MTAREAARVRWGVAALLLSGLLFTAGALLRGPDVMPTEPLAKFVRFVTGRHYTHGWYLIFAGQVFEASIQVGRPDSVYAPGTTPAATGCGIKTPRHGPNRYRTQT